MAELTNVTYLQRKGFGESEFSKLIDITSYPDLGGAPEQIDITTLSDRKLRNMNGLQAGDAFEFGALYKKADYERLNTIMEADREITDDSQLATYRLLFNDNGTNGIWEWQGRLSVYPVGGEPNARRDMSFTISDEGEQEIHYVDGEPTDPVSVMGVTLNRNTLTLEVGEDITLIASVEPSNATDRSISWSSDDEDIAVVDQTGKVLGVSEGSATITVTTTDGGKTATCEVTVEVVDVTGVTLDQNTLAMDVGDADVTLTATVAPTNATDKSVSWESDDDSVATVTNGVVHAVAAGTATITVKTTDGTFTDTCAVTVSNS